MVENWKLSRAKVSQEKCCSITMGAKRLVIKIFLGGENSPSPSMICTSSYSGGVLVSTLDVMSNSCSIFERDVGFCG